MEKTLRVLGGDEDEHGHTHSHSHVEPSITPSGHTSAAISNATPAGGLRSRSSAKASSESTDSDVTVVEENTKSEHSPSKLSAYLNLFGDFVHNM